MQVLEGAGVSMEVPGCVTRLTPSLGSSELLCQLTHCYLFPSSRLGEV